MTSTISTDETPMKKIRPWTRSAHRLRRAVRDFPLTMEMVTVFSIMAGVSVYGFQSAVEAWLAYEGV